MKKRKIKTLAFTMVIIALLASCGQNETASTDTNSAQSNAESVSVNDSQTNSEDENSSSSQSGNVAEEVVLWSAGTETDGKLDVYVEKYKGKSPIVNISNPDDSTIRFVAIKAFYENESIKEVTLPDTVTEIRSQCFAFCENLEKVNLGKGIEEIHSNAFVGCVNLKQVILEDKLKKIEEYAFSLCKSLEEIIIPPSCVEITNNAFAGNSENFKIKGEKGSYAEEFAKANDIPFEEYEFN